MNNVSWFAGICVVFLQEVGTMQIPANHANISINKISPFLMVCPLEESQGPSKLHGHNPLFMCAVGLGDGGKIVCVGISEVILNFYTL